MHRAESVKVPSASVQWSFPGGDVDSIHPAYILV